VELYKNNAFRKIGDHWIEKYLRPAYKGLACSCDIPHSAIEQSRQMRGESEYLSLPVFMAAARAPLNKGRNKSRIEVLTAVLVRRQVFWVAVALGVCLPSFRRTVICSPSRNKQSKKNSPKRRELFTP
jgi:hypothetical protein